MKNVFALILLSVTLIGCSGQFWGGAAGGALGTGAGYEYQADKNMRQLDEDLKAGRIDQHEYDIRKDQIQRGSLIK